MRRGTKISLIAIIAAITIFSLSCTGRKVSGSGAEKEIAKEQPQSTPAPGEEKRKLVFGALNKNKEPEKKAVSPVTDLAPEDYPVMLASLPSNAVMPADMVIGELQDVNSLNSDLRDLNSRVRDFFSAAFKGEFDNTQVKESSGEVIAQTLAKSSYRGDVSVRLGTFKIKKDFLEIPVRLLSKEGRTDGSIAVQKENDVWVISGLSMDLNKLNEKYIPAEEPYAPDSYMNLQLEY